MLKPGMFLGNRYEIGERIGSGGTSDVYRAVDCKLRRDVAIKVLKSEFSSDRNFVQKFRTEAQAAASLSHQNIVSVFDVGEEDDIYYIVMELIDGITLKRYIEKKGRLNSRGTIGIAIQIAQGLEVAHAEHIVHRDIKPQNVIISRDGKIKVTDFGIARAASSQTISSNAMGSVHYISPEQARGGYCDERSDIYSLGVTMYEMVTGTLPYDGDSTVNVALQHIQGEALAPSEYAPDIYFSLERIIEKCMQKKPEYRYANVSELIADLKRSLVSPDEDFVKITAVSMSRPTRVISEDELSQINSAASADEKEKAYLQGDDIDDDDDYYEDDDDYYDSDDDTAVGTAAGKGKNRRFEKMMIGIGIGVAALIVVLAIVVVGNVFGLFGNGRDTESEAVVEMEMPDIVGMDWDDAKDVLDQNNLTYTLEEAQDDEYEEGQVVDTDPPAGETVSTEDTIVVYVNSLEVEIPEGEIVGVNSTAAKAALTALGLNVEIEEEYSDDVEEGKVISCDPDEGSTVSMGDTVTLTVSKGTEDSAVPSVVGSGANSAASTIQNAGFTVESHEEASSTVASGYIIRQSPEAGTSAEPGSTVVIYISSGPEVTQVANVVGNDVSSAQSTLVGQGFTTSVSYANSDTVAQGHVISQTPNGGTSLTTGSAVSIVVSSGPSQTTSGDSSDSQ